MVNERRDGSEESFENGNGVDDFEGMRKPFNGGQRGGKAPSENRFKNEVLVRSLPFKASDADIEDFCGQFGTVGSLNLLKNPDGTSKGICFVRFEDEGAMQQAIDSSGTDFMGRKVVIEKTKPREERDSGFGARAERNDRDRPERGDRRDFGGRDSRGGNDRGGRERRDRDDYRDRSRERERRDDGFSGGRSQSKTIFVGNLNFSTSEDALRDFFEECGGIKDVRITTKPDGSVIGLLC